MPGRKLQSEGQNWEPSTKIQEVCREGQSCNVSAVFDELKTSKAIFNFERIRNLNDVVWSLLNNYYHHILWQ